MTPIAWSWERFGLGVPSIDDIHQEFVTLMNAVATASEKELPGLFAELCEHTRAHFAHEDALMIKYRFPAIIEHQGEHGRVLTELEDLDERVAQGRTALARAYVRDQLPEWFALHATTMDSALAAHIKHAEGGRREGSAPALNVMRDA
jgi:hemerythrin